MLIRSRRLSRTPDSLLTLSAPFTQLVQYPVRYLACASKLTVAVTLFVKSTNFILPVGLKFFSLYKRPVTSTTFEDIKIYELSGNLRIVLPGAENVHAVKVRLIPNLNSR